MEGPRVTGDPRDRRGSESDGSTPERWGGRWRSGTRGGGVERIWRGAGEVERGGDEAEARSHGGARAGNGGGLGLPAPAAAPSPLCGRPARAGGLRAHGPAHVPSRAGR